MNLRPFWLALASLCLGSVGVFSAMAVDDSTVRQIGVAKVDITPDYPVRLSGYAVRKKESEGIGSDNDNPALLFTVDNTGVPSSIRTALVQRLEKKRGIKPDRVALCSTHSHSAPCLAGNLPTLFGEPLPPEHQAHVERYTRELIDALEKLAIEALDNRQAARLSHGQGQALFAANRRTKGGPVDHDVPVLHVTDLKNQTRALFANYACHCTTLGGDMNQICGDWAGYAQEYLERDHPGATALIAIGCGADSNPQPRGSLELAKQHGQEICTVINKLLGGKLTPVVGSLECRAKLIKLPLDKLPTRQEWEQKAKEPSYVGYYGRVNLAKLDRGEALMTRLDYLVQTWNFGRDLALVFLPGEVVVDYSLRLKQEFDPGRLLVTAYANDVPCYIPSERILKERGYEGEGAMVYYDKPTRFAPGLEQLIVEAVHELLPNGFLAKAK
jgi:hypothetical protein